MLSVLPVEHRSDGDLEAEGNPDAESSRTARRAATGVFLFAWARSGTTEGHRCSWCANRRRECFVLNVQSRNNCLNELQRTVNCEPYVIA